ncbi:MAG TPA: ABC transporter substrate-binding protein [Xanthobacteraceae bacterium]|nr:ABC transporter substrate-binding protein [Xanthobacteraceae bacterium]
MRRREFIAGVGGLAAFSVVRPSHAQAQRNVKRIGVLMGLAADDPEGQARLAAFSQGLQQAGWSVGQNLQIDYRWAGGNAETMRKYAAEFAELAPDAILAHSSAAVAPLMRETKTIPIVFVLVADPVGAGFVESLARPGGNITGFTNFEYTIGGKWLELLKEISPRLERVAVLRESAISAGAGQFGAISAAAHRLGMELRPVDVRDPGEIERDLTAFGKNPNGGLIVTGSPAATVHRELIGTLALRYRLPTMYNSRFYVVGGGLAAYGPDFVDLFRRAAGYIDRVLRGEKPADLPVQVPVKYDLAINLKTAKALGIEIPTTMLVRASEVID